MHMQDVRLLAEIAGKDRATEATVQRLARAVAIITAADRDRVEPWIVMGEGLRSEAKGVSVEPRQKPNPKDGRPRETR